MQILSRPLVIIALLSGLGCGREPAETPIPAHTRGDGGTQAAVARIEAEQDPVRKLTMLRDLAREPEIELAPICEELGDPSLVQECAKLSRRPHLRQPAGGIDAHPPEIWGLKLPQEPVGPMAEVTQAPDSACAEQQPDARDTCQAQRAWELAEDGGAAAAAAAACAALTEGVDECMFRVSEIRALRQDAGGAASLCLASQRWMSQCLTHLSRHLGRPLPAAVPSELEAWRAMAARIDAASEAVEPAGDDLATALRAHAWVQAFGGSMMWDQRVDGSFLDQLPPEAAPQFRAALGWRLATAEMDFESLTRQVLAGSRGPIDLGPRRFVGSQEGTGWLWPPLLEEEQQLPTVSYVDGKRILAPEPQADAAICVLEGYNAHGSVPLSVLDAALSHPSALVRWTAARLLPSGDEGKQLHERARADSDPLVQLRERKNKILGRGGPVPFRAPSDGPREPTSPQ